ncbi:Platelet glycoprotein Ib alpha chain [Eumeta japonica]|uniref:Platelet glycoprotein Ib alpha chain n=1 Tax=Eumeta variegata TaxID=151549 RepID=A0A4C1VRV5_EUMVA|nr:Platelet glycoprotein Ib alpha chain [Eumeta japonica]
MISESDHSRGVHEQFSIILNSRILDLSYIEIDSIPMDAFRGLSKLQQIDLSGNEFTMVPESLGLVGNSLEYLTFNNNPIAELNDDSFLGIGSKILHWHRSQFEKLRAPPTNAKACDIYNARALFALSAYNISMRRCVSDMHWREEHEREGTELKTRAGRNRTSDRNQNQERDRDRNSELKDRLIENMKEFNAYPFGEAAGEKLVNNIYRVNFQCRS